MSNISNESGPPVGPMDVNKMEPSETEQIREPYKLKVGQIIQIEGTDKKSIVTNVGGVTEEEKVRLGPAIVQSKINQFTVNHLVPGKKTYIGPFGFSTIPIHAPFSIGKQLTPDEMRSAINAYLDETTDGAYFRKKREQYVGYVDEWLQGPQERGITTDDIKASLASIREEAERSKKAKEQKQTDTQQNPPESNQNKI